MLVQARYGDTLGGIWRRDWGGQVGFEGVYIACAGGLLCVLGLVSTSRDSGR